MKRRLSRKRFDKELLKDIFVFLGSLFNLVSVILKCLK
ncbi:hypothetical protein BCD93_003741 [Clostridium saccharoperbutylacetonicum]|nr:hypothetical protein [Clostridium saccharoperbutylacetonicum]